jgi:hypothetical protein
VLFASRAPRGYSHIREGRIDPTQSLCCTRRVALARATLDPPDGQTFASLCKGCCSLTDDQRRCEPTFLPESLSLLLRQATPPLFPDIICGNGSASHSIIFPARHSCRIRQWKSWILRDSRTLMERGHFQLLHSQLLRYHRYPSFSQTSYYHHHHYYYSTSFYTALTRNYTFSFRKRVPINRAKIGVSL